MKTRNLDSKNETIHSTRNYMLEYNDGGEIKETVDMMQEVLQVRSLD